MQISMVVAFVVALGGVARAQEVETESARLLRPGMVKGGVGLEYQASADGRETAIPTFVEGGLHERLELVVEPVVFTALQPATGAHAHGLGDLEITLIGLARHESAYVPAIAFAAEVKVPTARNALIGTTKTDAAGYLILSKRFGNLDVHANANYTFVGKPDGVMTIHNTIGGALAARYFIGKADVFAEVLATTAATPDSEVMGGTMELAGAEVVAAVGGGYFVTDWLQLYLGLSIDNNAAFVVHPGITLVHRAW